MKNYIISERQLKLISEVHVPHGKFEKNSIGDFFSATIMNWMDNKGKKIIKLIRKFFEEEIGTSITDWDNEDIRIYLNDIVQSNFKKDKLHNTSVAVSLGYYLIKNLYHLKKYNGLEFIKIGEYSDVDFFFFDPEIEEYVGTIKLTGIPKLENSYRVLLSQVEKEYVGRGYGSRMYLCVISYCDYLISDSILYKESLNIWVNYLPKHVNVWAKINNGLYEMTGKKFINPEYVKFYIASNLDTPPNLHFSD